MEHPDPTPVTRSPARWMPEGHELPEFYEYRFGGIWQVTPRTDRNGQEITPNYTRVTFGPLAIAAAFASDRGEQWFDLVWRDGPDLVTRRVDGATVRSGKALVRELGGYGIPVIEADSRVVERYLASYHMTNRRALQEARTVIARHLGWQDDGQFVTADGTPRPVEPGQDEQRPALAAHRPSGSLSGWQEVCSRIEAYPVPRLVLAAAFAAPLLATLQVASFTVDISGRSTRGKTTAAQTAASVWFDPGSNSQAMGTWKAGIIMIEKRLNLVRGLPVVLDETRVVKSPDIVDQILYQVPMNQGAARGGGWPSQLPWHTILISTGEQPALSFTSHEGAAARILSLRRAPFGLGGAQSAEDARAVTEIIAEHHGTAGPAYVAKLRELLAEPDGPAKLRKRHQEMVDAHKAAATTDIARRRAPLSAALHLGAELAHAFEIVPLEPLPLEVWTELLSDEQAREDRGELALDVVRALIASQEHRLVPVNGFADAPAGGWIGAHTEEFGGAVALLPAALADALNRATPPIAVDAVREAWAERGSIVLDGKRLVRARVNGNRVRCYVFPRTVIEAADAEGEHSEVNESSIRVPTGPGTSI